MKLKIVINTMQIKQYRSILAVVSILSIIGGGWYVWQVAPIGAAYKAKLLCSAVFVSHRNPDEFIATDLSFEVHPTLSIINTHIDNKTQTVYASMFGWRGRWARFYPDKGCILSHEIGTVTPAEAVVPPNVTPTAPIAPVKSDLQVKSEYSSNSTSDTIWPTTESRP